MSRSWETVDPPDVSKPRVRKTLIKRANKRTGYQVGADQWIVNGDPKLGDSYTTYHVHLPQGGKKYHCSCQDHSGGHFRPLCSHIIYVSRARKGRVEFVPHPDGDKFAGTLDSQAERFVTNDDPSPEVPLSVPPYVEGSGKSIKESRTALHWEYGGWDNPFLPGWVKYLRPEQYTAVNEILELYAEGKKVVFLDAPTGAGKTLIGELVRRKFSPRRALYTCSTKTLQDQFLKDFTYAAVIKGRANYPTVDNPKAFPIIAANACDAHRTELPACAKCPEDEILYDTPHCDLCHPVSLCPYRIAKATMLSSSLAVANIAYLLAAANYQEFLNKETLTIVDEADVLESELMRFVEFRISAGAMKKYRISKPPEKKTVRKTWVEWIREIALPALWDALDQADARAKGGNVRARVEVQRIWGMIEKLRWLGGWIPENKRENIDEAWGEDLLENWVYADYEQGHVAFKPIDVRDHAQDYLWDHAERWLLMSASIISAQQMAADLGLEDDEWGVVNVPSNFPPEQRPIYVQPIANMTFKEKDTAWPTMRERVREVSEQRHPDERILVHTVSYALAKYLATGEPRAYTYTNAAGREEALRGWLQSRSGIMFAPSFDRGIDLPNDECRAVIVAKIPYPNLKDKQINKRLYTQGGQGWYAMLTVRSLIQMTGRAMRSVDDHCEIYLLDRQFMSNVYRKSKRLLPEWWQEALVMSGIPKG